MGLGPRLPLAPALFGASLAMGCARVAPLPPRAPELPLEPWEGGASPKPESLAGAKSDSPPPTDLAKSGPLPITRPPAVNAPVTGPTTRTAPSSIVGGAGCLTELAARGVRFSRSEPVLGVATPIVVESPISGVRFFTLEKKPLVLDCRLALALSEIAPDLRALGVNEARYSGAYVYRTSHPGRMSLHAYGLAIDLHEFKVNGQSFVVKTAFEKGRACGAALPLLNQIACRVREKHLFHEQLGPDDNAAHHDHFHLGIRPLPEEIAADLPWPAAPARRPAARKAPARPGSIPEVPPNGSRRVTARARTEPERHAR